MGRNRGQFKSTPPERQGCDEFASDAQGGFKFQRFITFHGFLPACFDYKFSAIV
jgi:hypothetical protein